MLVLQNSCSRHGPENSVRYDNVSMNFISKLENYYIVNGKKIS